MIIMTIVIMIVIKVLYGLHAIVIRDNGERLEHRVVAATLTTTLRYVWQNYSEV